MNYGCVFYVQFYTDQLPRIPEPSIHPRKEDSATMPRKRSDLSPSTRVRENQRRSRTRRKELIDELQARLRQYERKEVQATVAMQLAARRVSWENAQLRDLLSEKGVSTEEIKAFLCGREGRQGKAALVPSCNVAVGGLPVNIAAQACEGTAGTPTGQRFTEQWGQDIDTGYQAAVKEVNGQVVAGTPASKLKKRVPRRSSPTSTSFAIDDSMLEMSCEMAAEIISGMRENEDREQTRSKLGCAGHGQCNVKNITVLQLMAMD